jgi:hypothetical protein
VLVNNSTIINNVNNYLSAQLTIHKNKHDIWCLKSMSWFGSETKQKGFNWWIRSSLLIIGSPASNAYINICVHFRSSQKWMRTININTDSRIAGSVDAQNRLMTYIFWFPRKTIHFFIFSWLIDIIFVKMSPIVLFLS